MDRRLRVSLLARMAVSICILATVALAVGSVVALLGGMLGLAAARWLRDAVVALASLPRVSAVVPVPPSAVAATALLVVVGTVRWWPSVRAHAPLEYLLPPTTPGAAAVVAGLLGCLYLVTVESAAAVVARLTAAGGIAVVILLGGGLAVWAAVRGTRIRVRDLRTRALENGTLLEYTRPEVAATVRRLAQQADVPPPAVHITDSGRPESVTFGSGEDAVVLVSAGLVEALPEAELEAVLAHEVAHLANGDSRVMGAALGPVLAADDWIDDNPNGLGDYFWNWLFGLLKTYGQFGVALLSRGRERAADAAAAELMGSPAALAAALERLTEARRRPKADLREWERSVAVMDILPPEEPDVSTGPFRTHPPTAERVEHLSSLTEPVEVSR